MSGPKAVSVAVAPAAAASIIPALIIGGITVVTIAAIAYATNKTAEYININRIKSEIKAVIDKVNAICALIKSKKIDKIGMLKESLDDYHRHYAAARSAAGFEKCGDLKILESCLKEVKSAELALNKIDRNIKAKIIELRDSFVRKSRALENSKKAIAESYSSCNILVDSGKIKELKTKLELLSDIIIPEVYDFDYNHFDIAKILNYQNELNATEIAIKAAGAKSIEYIKAIDRSALADILSGVETENNKSINKSGKEFLKNIQSAKYTTIDDLIKEKKNNMKPDDREKKFIKKASALFSKFSYLSGTEEYLNLLIKFDKLKDEEFVQRRALLYDDFLFACDKLLNDDKKKTKTLNELIEVKRQLIALETPHAVALVEEFEKAIELKDISKSEQLKKKAIAAVEADVKKINDQHIGSVIKSAFDELGYETDENFDTMLVRNQKMFINKPSMKNYQVQVVSNSDNAMLQVEVVRGIENEHELNESTKSHETRDIEVETEFCKDYDKVLKKLEENGIQVSQKMRKKPGEVKVRKVLTSAAGNKKSSHRSEIKLEERSKL